jgi:PAS domain S-box-containing protein
MPLVGPFILVTSLLCAASSAAVAMLCHRHRSVRGATVYSAVAWTGALWGATATARVLASEPATKLVIANVQFVLLQGWAILLTTFTIAFAWPTARRVWAWGAAFALPAAVVSIAAIARGGASPFFVNAQVTGVHPFTILLADLSPIATALYAYSAVLVIGGMLLLTPRLFGPHRLYRRQVALVLIGNALPVAGSLLSTTVLHLRNSGVATVTLPLGQVFVALGLLRYRLFDIVPLARGQVMSHLVDPVVVLDADNRVLDFNPALTSWLDVPAEDALGRPAEVVFGRWASLVAAYRDVEETAERLVLRGPDGHERTIEMRVQPIRDPDGTLRGRIIHSRDISDLAHAERELRRHRDELEELVWDRTSELTHANDALQRQAAERERLEEELQRVQQLEAMGRLAGGVAHHFNNLLVPILGYTEVGLGRIAPGGAGREELERIHQSAGQAAELARQMLAFSRRQVLEMRVHDLNAIVAEMDQVLGGITGERVELDVRPGARPLPVRADRGQLQQVIVNLVMHCCAGMAGGGRLRLTLGEETGAEPHVLLTLTDTAAALDAAARSHLFEPFAGGAASGGAGMGLATAYGIVRQHDGTIEVAPAGEVGNVYRVRLPRSVAPLAPATAPTPPASDAVPRGASVMVVEDDEGVRDLVATVLRANGYRVLEARDAAECARLLETDASEIELLLSDVVLPDGSGRDIERMFTAHHPKARVAFMSGYADELFAHFGVRDERTLVLQKPFSVDQLLAKVKAALA